MAQSLQDILLADLGAGAGSVKTAAAAAASAPATTGDTDIEKLAASLGLFQPTTADTTGAAATAGAVKTAAEEEAEKKKKEEEEKDKGKHPPFGEKMAGLEVGGLYESLFGGSPHALTAPLDKTAAAEEALGARARDYFESRFAQRVEKVAYAALSGSPHKGDSQPPNHLPDNKASRDAGGGPINTAPVIDNQITPANTGATVGKEGAGGSVNVKTAEAECLRKHLLISAQAS